MAFAAIGTAATSALPYASTTSLGLVLSTAIGFGLIVFVPVAIRRVPEGEQRRLQHWFSRSM